MTAQKYRTAKIKPDVLILSWSSFNNIYDSLQDEYQIFITDEWHHLSSKRKDQMNLWKWDFIVAFTATPERKEYWPESFRMYFWTIYDTQKQSLPVHVIEYDYDYNYNIEEIMKSQEGLSPESPEFYRRLYSINDDRTNKLDLIIKELIIQKEFKKIIVFVDRRAHVEQIKRLIPFAIPLTGDENIDDFNKTIQGLDSYLIVALEQCAGEWFDLPALECWILFVSSSRVNTIDQTAGRMRRYFEGKEKAFYIDFQDTITFMWGKKKRLGIYERRKIYKEKGWTTQSFEDFIWLEF